MNSQMYISAEKKVGGVGTDGHTDTHTHQEKKIDKKTGKTSLTYRH